MREQFNKILEIDRKTSLLQKEYDEAVKELKNKLMDELVKLELSYTDQTHKEANKLYDEKLNQAREMLTEKEHSISTKYGSYNKHYKDIKESILEKAFNDYVLNGDDLND